MYVVYWRYKIYYAINLNLSCSFNIRANNIILSTLWFPKTRLSCRFPHQTFKHFSYFSCLTHPRPSYFSLIFCLYQKSLMDLSLLVRHSLFCEVENEFRASKSWTTFSTRLTYEHLWLSVLYKKRQYKIIHRIWRCWLYSDWHIWLYCRYKSDTSECLWQYDCEKIITNLFPFLTNSVVL